MIPQSPLYTPKRSEGTLAPELWHIIATLLLVIDRNALVQLSNVSKALLQLIRPYYYTKVAVNLPAHTLAVNLLARDGVLAKVVKQFTILMPEVPGSDRRIGYRWTDMTNRPALNAITNMTALENLSMSGSLFAFESEKQDFVDMMNRREVKLKRFAFNEAPGCLLIPGEELNLVGLERVSWSSFRESQCFIESLVMFRANERSEFFGREISHDVDLWRGFLSNLGTLLNSSFTTITSLHLPFIDSKERVYQRLWSANFPQLNRLMLGNVEFEPENATIAFSRFLSGHDLIEELKFENVSAAHYRFGAFPSPYIRKDTLPKLRSFKGNTHVFLQYATAHPNSLRETLTKLDLIPNNSGSAVAWISFFSALAPDIEDQIPLPVLKELKFDLKDWAFMDLQEVMGFLNWVLRICGPSLEVFLGTLPPTSIRSNILCNTLMQFPNLRSVYLCERVIQGGGDPLEESVEEYVSNMGELCAKLEEVVVTKHIVKDPPGPFMITECDETRSVTHTITR